MKLTKEQVIFLYKALEQFQKLEKEVLKKDLSASSNPKFRYMINKNILLLKTEFQALGDMERDIVSRTEEYEKALAELNGKFGIKDEKTGQWFIAQDKFPDYSSGMKDLKEKFKDTVSLFEKELKDYKTYLKESIIEIELTKIDYDLVPVWVYSDITQVLMEVGIIT